MLRPLLIALLGASVLPIAVSHPTHHSTPEFIPHPTANAEQAVTLQNVGISTQVQGLSAVSELRISINNATATPAAFPLTIALPKGVQVLSYQLDQEPEVSVNHRGIIVRSDFQLKVHDIPANGARVLKLRVKSALEQIANQWRYQLPIGFAQGVNKLSIEIINQGLTVQPIMQIGSRPVALIKTGSTFTASLDKPQITSASLLTGTLNLGANPQSIEVTKVTKVTKGDDREEVFNPSKLVVDLAHPPAEPRQIAPAAPVMQKVEVTGSRMKEAMPLYSTSNQAILARASAPYGRVDYSYPQASSDTAKYQHYTENAWKRVDDEPVSTFSADVDTGSYANVRRFLQQGSLPAQDAVRTEELVNYFSYEYALPSKDSAHPFSVHTETSVSPWNKDRLLMRVAIKGKDVAKELLPPANLVFLVDVSGSMSPSERLPLIKSALKLLTSQLRAKDRVSLVTYADGTGVVLPPTSGSEKEKIMMAIDQLLSGGSTNGEGGLRLAYQQARAAKIDGGINRVLLATDGDLNVGVTDPNELKALVERERKSGISLSTLGVGDHNYNDALMKKLADNGDGSYHYLDSLQEAHKVLVNEFTSTLSTIAQDLKLQLEFNPKNVAEYRLIGYELRALTREQFNDDKVDAGDIGAGHTVTALYEIVPTGSNGNVDPLRYGERNQRQIGELNSIANSQFKNELAWLKLRYKNPGESKSILVQVPIIKAAQAKAIENTDKDFRFATAVAAWSQWLRGSPLIGDFSASNILKLARDARGEDKFGHRAEFIRLVELSSSLKPSEPAIALTRGR